MRPQEHADTRWAFELARCGASPAVIAICCHKGHRWARKIVLEAGAGPPKRYAAINRERVFGGDVERRVHAHLLVRLFYAKEHIDHRGERLVSLYRSYRAMTGPGLFTIDEVHDLDGLLAEGPPHTAVCASCRRRFYSVSLNSSACPGCEALTQHLCKTCKKPIPQREGEEGLTRSRGRPREHCTRCNSTRPHRRSPRRAPVAAKPRAKRGPTQTVTSVGGSGPPRQLPAQEASRFGR